MGLNNYFHRFISSDQHYLSKCTKITLFIERNPFPAKSQALRSFRVYISATKASSALIQTESNREIINAKITEFYLI